MADTALLSSRPSLPALDGHLLPDWVKERPIPG